jgi:hypothetical protein
MGEVNPELNQVEQTTMKNDSGKQVSVVKIRFNLANPVSTSMYTYLEQRQQLRLINLKRRMIIPLQETINFEPTRNPTSL